MLVCEMMVQIVTVVGGTPVNKQLNHVASLLQFMPADTTAEIAFNRREAAMAPHCSVCSLFVPVTAADVTAILSISQTNNANKLELS